MRIPVIVVFIIGLLAVDIYLEAANGDIFKTLKIRQPDRPSVCIFEPSPETTDDWDRLEIATLMGIYEWEIKLRQAYPEGDWMIEVWPTVPWEEHMDKTASDYPHCSVMINFEKEHADPASNALGTTGILFNNSYHKFMFINIYMEHTSSPGKIKINLTGDSDKQTIKVTLKKQVLDINTVRGVVLHEMGHALGLEHYQTNTSLRDGEYGTDRSAMYYSININDPEQKLQVRGADTRMIEQIYGEDGWTDKTPIWTIKECNVINSILYDCK